jgi:hypothetical protein
MKAFQVWRDGECWFDIREDGAFVAAVGSRKEAVDHGATAFVDREEPRFLIRDGSGRGGAAEVSYTEFTLDERSHCEESFDVDGEPEDVPTFGDWLDSSCAGDEYENTDQNYTVIRIN